MWPSKQVHRLCRLGGGNAPPRVMLSYGGASNWDGSVAQLRDDLEGALRAKGHRRAEVLVDVGAVSATRAVATEVSRLVAEADALVVLLSPAWLGSDWCRVAEHAAAERAGIPIASIRWEVVADPGPLRGRHLEDWTGPKDPASPAWKERVDRLADDLVGAVPALRAGNPEPPRVVRRARARMLAAVALVACPVAHVLAPLGAGPPEAIPVVELRDPADDAAVREALARLRPARILATADAVGVVAGLDGVVSLGAPAWSYAPAVVAGGAVGFDPAKAPALAALLDQEPPTLASLARWRVGAGCAPLDGEGAMPPSVLDLSAAGALTGGTVVLDRRGDDDLVTLDLPFWCPPQRLSEGRLIAVVLGQRERLLWELGLPTVLGWVLAAAAGSSWGRGPGALLVLTIPVAALLAPWWDLLVPALPGLLPAALLLWRAR